MQNSSTFRIITAVLSNIVSQVLAAMQLKSMLQRFANPERGLAMASTLVGN